MSNMTEMTDVHFQRAATVARFKDQGPSVAWATIARAFGWNVDYFEHPEFEDTVCVTLTFGARKLEFTPAHVLLLDDEHDTCEEVCGDEAVLAVIRFGRRV